MSKHLHIITNLIIALAGINLLVNGQARQRFFTIFDHCTFYDNIVKVFEDNQELDQQIGQVLLFFFSLVSTSIIFTSNVIWRVFAISIFAIQICFCQNVAYYHSFDDIGSFLTEMLIMGTAIMANVDDYLRKNLYQQQEGRK